MSKVLPTKFIWSYAGLKLLVATSASLVFCLFGGLSAWNRFAVTPSEWLDYAWPLTLVFWSNQWVLLLGVMLCWTAFFFLDAAEPLHYAINGRTLFPRRDYQNLRRLRRLGIYSAILFLIILLVFLPVISPRGVPWLGYALSALGLLGTAAGIISNLDIRTGAGFGDYQRKINYSFARCSFDTASTAPISEEVQRAINQRSPVDLPQLLSNLNQLLGVRNDSIRLHTNTTAAYDHALREMLENGFSARPPIVLASDAEYPNIETLLKDRMSSANPIQLASADIRKLLWDGASNETIISAYIEKAREQPHTIQVLALCHVHHATGRVLPVLQIIDRLEKEGLWSPSEGCVLIDGAQSVGNIEIDSATWDRCDFYAFCGHKWLLGKASLGMLFTKRYPMHREEWKEIRLLTGLSRTRDPHEEYGSTTDVESRISLEASIQPMKGVGLAEIARWNSSLADLFRNKLPLAEAGLYPVGLSGGGIVTVLGDKPRVRKITNYLAKFYDKITTFESPIVPLKEEAAIRFCFHCFHSRDDVFRLIERLRESPVS